jgi:hypothetical protein
MADINKRVPRGFFFYRQFQHFLILVLLAVATWFFIQPAFDGGMYLGVTDRTWAMLSIGLVVAHQVLGWLVFRGQICFSAFTRIFGKADLTVWGILFFPLLIARPLVLLAAGLADPGSLGGPRSLHVVIGGIILAPAFYTFWSVVRYFGFERALGGDHFRMKYRHMPMVREGVFKYTSNAMYTFVLLSFWAIALFCGSRVALGLAAFQHAYIWVHMYTVEKPDLEVIHGRAKS